MIMAKTRIALVGLGMAVAPHAKSVLDLAPRVEVAYAYSPSAARRATFSQKFPFPQCDRLETILEDRTVAAVAILTPPNTHLDLVARSASAGKHVLVEKPLEITTARADQMVTACRRAGVKLGVVLQHRHKPAVERLAGAVRGGELGGLIGASAIIRLWRPQSYYDDPGRGTQARDGGGVLLTQGIHTLDVLLSLAGDAEEVTSFATTTPVHRMECEDLVCAAVRWRSGALGVIEATTATRPKDLEGSLSILGEGGTVVVGGFAMNRMDTWQFAEPAPGDDLVMENYSVNPPNVYGFGHQAYYEHLVDCLENGKNHLVDGLEGRRSLELISAIYQSIERGAEVVLGGPPPRCRLGARDA